MVKLVVCILPYKKTKVMEIAPFCNTLQKTRQALVYDTDYQILLEKSCGEERLGEQNTHTYALTIGAC